MKREKILKGPTSVSAHLVRVDGVDPKGIDPKGIDPKDGKCVNSVHTSRAGS